MKILTFPNRWLTAPGGKVGPTLPVDLGEIDDTDVMTLIATAKGVLANTPNGLALAANQVGLPWRFFVINDDFARENEIPTVVINPELSFVGDSKVTMNEGCLSFPGVQLDITRHENVRVKFYDNMLRQHDRVFNGMPARVFLHECEHLDGMVFTRNIDRITRFQIEGAMRKGRSPF